MPLVPLSRASVAAAVAGTLACGLGVVTAPAQAVTTTAWTPALTIRTTAVTDPTGLARSSDAANGWLFTANGHGAGTRVYALTPNGSTKSTITLKGAKNVDWEDLATGPGRRVWVADSGDDSLTRGGAFTAYAFTEPTSWRSSLTVTPTAYAFATPDGARDIEAMMVDPSTGRLYFVSRAASGAAVYRAPATLSSTATNPLTKVADAPAGVTSASWAPDGAQFLLGTASAVYVYSTVGAEPRTFSLPTDTPGTSLEISADGRTVYAGSSGSRSTVYSTPSGLTSPLASTLSMSLVPGAAPTTATNGPTTFLDGSAAVSFTVPSVANVGGGLALGTTLRSSNGADGYRAEVRIGTDGTRTAFLRRVVAGAESTLGSVALPGLTSAGDSIRIEADVAGTGTSVMVRMRSWEHGQTAPDWQLSVADTAASRVTTSGTSYAWAALSSTAPGTLSAPYGAPSVTRVNVAPSAAMETAVTDLTADFDASGSADPDGRLTSYAWTFGDGSTATGPTVARTFSSAGTYEANLTVTDDDGATATLTRSVTVTAPVAPPAPTVTSTSAPLLLGMYRGNPSEDPDTSFRNLYGAYPMITSSYYLTQAPNEPYEVARVRRGTNVYLDFDTKSTPGQIGLIADRDATTMTNWVDRNLAAAQRIAAAGKPYGAGVYVSFVHEWEVKRAQNVLTDARDRDPATYAKALDVFTERARALAPDVQVVYWSGGYSGNQPIIGQVMSLMKHAPDVVAWDPYVTKNGSASTTATQLFASFSTFLDNNATYAAWGRPTKALGEFGMSTTFGDAAVATFMSGVEKGMAAHGITHALQFDRDSSSYAYKIDGGATPLAQASFGGVTELVRAALQN